MKTWLSEQVKIFCKPKEEGQKEEEGGKKPRQEGDKRVTSSPRSSLPMFFPKRHSGNYGKTNSAFH